MGRSTGPKAAADTSPLPFVYRGKGSRRLVAFAREYITVPKGKGAGKPLKVRAWQRELLGSVFDAKPRPRVAGWCLPRGQGKSTLICVPALYELFLGEMGASVVVAAVDERQAGIIFNTAVRMIELNAELSRRVQVYRDKIVCPGNGGTFQVLPATPAALEGLDYSLAIVDELGRVQRETWEVLSLAQGKRAASTLIGIGTPGPDPDNVLATLRASAQADPDDPLTVYREHSAAGFEAHPVDCRHCWELANPALGDFLFEDGLTANLPPKMTEAHFRRARLCQFVTGSDERYLDAAPWNACADERRRILPGASVVVGFDGSRVSDSTALVVVSIEKKPIVEIAGLWEPHLQSADYRVPVLLVEEKIRQLADIYDVKEVVCDPFSWSRSIEVLAQDGLPMAEFPNTRERMAGPIAAFRDAVNEGELTHTDDAKLTAHVTNAVIVEHARGFSVAKPSAKSSRKIDALVAAIMAHSRARWHLQQKPKSKLLRVW